MSEKHFTVLAGEHGDQHRRFNYNLCTAVDLTKLSIALEHMVKAGRLDPRVADIYKKIAEGLLAALRSENDRAFGFQTGRPTEFKCEQAGSRGPFEEPDCEHDFFKCQVPAGDACVPIYHEVCRDCMWDRTKGQIMPKTIWNKWAKSQLKAEPECEHYYIRCELPDGATPGNTIFYSICKFCMWNKDTGRVLSKEDWDTYVKPHLSELTE